VTRLAAGDLRSDPAQLIDAIKAVGFFPGPRAVVVDQATDGLAPVFETALQAWARGDAAIVALAGDLKPKGALRKLFEGARNAVAIVLEDTSPTAEEIAALCARAGLGRLPPESRALMADLAGGMDAGAFRSLLETLSMFKRGDDSDLTPAEITALAPQSLIAETESLLFAVAEGQVAEIAPILLRVRADGVAMTKVCIDGLRHFRTLLALAADPEGPGSAVGRLRPPVPYRLRDRTVRQAQSLGRERIERALGVLIDSDLTLRSASRAPQEAMLERALIRIAMLAPRR
jgi:DNA polymerase-3 subunit delta